MKPQPVVHFEMPADDKTRMKKFYEQAFGWQMQQMGPDMGNYVLVTTAETDENRMVKEPGAINGGFYERAKPDERTRLTISVDDIHAAMKAVAAAGGKVIGGMQNPPEPDMIPGVGLYALFVDTEGNILSMMQSVRK